MKRIAEIIKFAFVASLSLCFTSCHSESDEGPEVPAISAHYIETYLIPNSVGTSMKDSTLYLEIKGGYIAEGNEQYNELAEKYNDLSYNRGKTYPTRALYDGVSSITITTTSYFDEAHPAGSDITDIVDCAFLTYYEYIQSGYTKEGEHAESLLDFSSDHGTKMYEMGLSEVDYDNTQLMRPQMILEFTDEPEESGTYEFQLLFKMPEVELGTIFEYTF